MQNPGPFDLNRAIQDWRARVANSAVFRNENVDELESHLRDSVSRLRAAGLSEEEAWTAAKRNLGEYEALEREFAKINKPVRVWRAATSMMIGVIVATLFFQANRPFSDQVWWTFSQEWIMSGLGACAAIIPGFLLLIVPLFALLRKRKRELPWWRAFGTGGLVSLVIWISWLFYGYFEPRPLVLMGGFVAWGTAVAVYARFKVTPRVARILSGAWMGVGGTVLCHFATGMPQFSQQWHSWKDWVMMGLIGPFLATAGWSCFAFPMGAAVGAWMPQRLKEASARKSFALGLAVGAGVGVLATLLRFLMGEIPILLTKYDPNQLELVQEAFFRETFVMLRNVVPTTALWVGMWAWVWNRRLSVERSAPSEAREGLIFLSTCGALLVLTVILWPLGINLWPLVVGLAPITIPLYLLVRLTSWMLRKRRSRS